MIAEQGTHEELIEKNGVYKRLVLRQLEKNAGDIDADLDDENSDGVINSGDDGEKRPRQPSLARQISDSFM